MGAPTKKIRVMVVDDSAAIRRLLSDLLSAEPSIEVVGTAQSAIIANEKLEKLAPDVLTLDIDMPGMDGLTFLGQIMRTKPMPVIMVSSRTQEGAAQTLRALELGAVDFLPKPTTDTLGRLADLGADLIEKVQAAARSRLLVPRKLIARTERVKAAASAPSVPLIVMGASTGGVNALQEILAMLPDDGPGVVIAQHMPKGFTRSFAERCDSFCSVRVYEAHDGDPVMRGQVLIAPGDCHLQVVRGSSGYQVSVSQGPRVNGHRPSIDVLFESAAHVAGPSAVGVILTGMGRDGAEGLLQMRRAGARTIAQDEATCVVFGMPQEAIALGAAEEVLPLEAIADRALQLSDRKRAAGQPPPSRGQSSPAHRR